MSLKGKVKWFNGKKGYGFIEREDKEKDVFVHASAVRDAGLRFLNEGDEIKPHTLTGDQLLGDIGESEEIFLIDPWQSAYIYEFPRSDGHSGYLLFSMGPDKKSSSFTSELTSTPEKQSIDNDNIPPSEPGKW